MEQINTETQKDCIIGIDHNLDFLKQTTHRATENFINLMLEKSSFPCITRPTRVMKNSAMLIDNIFVSSHLHSCMKSSVIVHDLNDHFPSILIIENILVNKKEPFYMAT